MWFCSKSHLFHYIQVEVLSASDCFLKRVMLICFCITRKTLRSLDCPNTFWSHMTMQKRHIKCFSYYVFIYFKLTMLCFFFQMFFYFIIIIVFSRHWPTLRFWVIWLIMFQNCGKKISKIHFQVFILLHFMYLSL